jgi:predicted phosphohydrolase
MKNKYLWFTDTHLDKIAPWKKYLFGKHLARENPTGVFLTGDISNGRQTVSDLERLASQIACPIYFVLGNHDYHHSSIAKTHDNIRKICQKHSNLIWMTEAGVVHLNEEVALIGTEGWYDAEEGKPEYLKMTFDWMLVDDFRQLPNMAERIKAWRRMADQSADDITYKLEKAIEQNYKSIYLLTHVPPWKEATRDVGTFMERFWLPYNTNLRLGRAIEKVMSEHKKRYITVLAGHTHTDCWIHVARNIECKVSKAKYYGEPRNEEHIFI